MLPIALLSPTGCGVHLCSLGGRTVAVLKGQGQWKVEDERGQILFAGVREAKDEATATEGRA